MPHPTIAPTRSPFGLTAPKPLHDVPTTELVDEVGGVWFEIWIPQGAQTARLSLHEILVGYEAGKQTLQMAITIARDLPLDYEIAQWRASGAMVLRAEQLVDGYFVTTLGDRCLDVVRLVRHSKATVRCHVHVVLALRSGWQPQSCAEALCASLQIR